MRYKLLAFDLDGTLAQPGCGTGPEDVLKLKALEQRGFRIAVCSGKPTYYLCGFLRQVGLEQPLMVGENGATFQFGVELPPKQYYEYPYGEKAKKQIRFFRERIEAGCGSKVWFQPNEVQLTPFIRDDSVFDEIQRIIDANPDQMTELIAYRHADCFDFVPNNVNKLNGMMYLGKLTGIAKEEMISFGDGVNDIPMFRGTGLSIAIGKEKGLPAKLRFDTIGEALTYVLSVYCGNDCGNVLS